MVMNPPPPPGIVKLCKLPGAVYGLVHWTKALTSIDIPSKEMYIISRLPCLYSQGFQERYGNMTNSEEWYGKMADNENSILKESYGNMTLSSSGSLGIS